MCRDAEERIVVRGVWGTVEYAERSNGEMPARDFIDALSDSDKRKLAVLFERMAHFGYISNQEHFKKEEGKIFAFKRHQIRIGCFQLGRRWVLTHGFQKKCAKWPRSELERADSIRKEHLMRRSEGT